MLDFDPNSNKKEAKPKIWAAYCPNRSPKFKTYTSRGHAVNALNYHIVGIIYELVDGEWVEWLRQEEPTECAHCSGSFERTPRGYMHRLYGYTKCEFKFQQPYVCDECYWDHFSYGRASHDSVGNYQQELL